MNKVYRSNIAAVVKTCRRAARHSVDVYDFIKIERAAAAAIEYRAAAVDDNVTIFTLDEFSGLLRNCIERAAALQYAREIDAPIDRGDVTALQDACNYLAYYYRVDLE